MALTSALFVLVVLLCSSFSRASANEVEEHKAPASNLNPWFVNKLTDMTMYQLRVQVGLALCDDSEKPHMAAADILEQVRCVPFDLKSYILFSVTKHKWFLINLPTCAP